MVSALPPHPAAPASVPPRLRPATFDDYERIERLVREHDCSFPSESDWRSLWLENPLRARLAKNAPIGWVLETRDGELVGTMGTVQTLYAFNGSSLVNAMGRAWFVKEPYRGFALALMAEYFGQDS